MDRRVKDRRANDRRAKDGWGGSVTWLRRLLGPGRAGNGAPPDLPEQSIPRPPLADWAWRPAPWARLLTGTAPGADVATGAQVAPRTKVFHDGRADAVALAQDGADAPPHALILTTRGFGGSFVSLAIDLPDDVTSGLHGGHLLRVDLSVTADPPVTLFLRLNLRCGPNTHQQPREVPRLAAPPVVEFDLAQIALGDRRVDKAWIDLIADAPGTAVVTIADLRISRRPRAGF